MQIIEVYDIANQKVKINWDYYPDGSVKLNIDSKRLPSRIVWTYAAETEMVSFFYIVSHLKRLWPQAELVLELPYIPQARMDRVKNEDEVFTLKYFANFINSFNFDQVIVVDAHSNVSLGLIDRVVNVEPIHYLSQIQEKFTPDVIFFPDEGARKRYGDEAMRMFPNAEIAFGMKNRDWRTGEIKGLEVIGWPEERVFPKVLIIDDICSYGGTFFYSAEALRKKGAGEIQLFVSHLEDSFMEGKLALRNDLISKIWTLNTIFHPYFEHWEGIRNEEVSPVIAKIGPKYPTNPKRGVINND